MQCSFGSSLVSCLKLYVSDLVLDVEVNAATADSTNALESSKRH